MFEDAGAYPLVATGAHRGRRAKLVGVLLIGAAQDGAGQKSVEDDPVRDAWPVATQKVFDFPFRKQGVELFQEQGR